MIAIKQIFQEDFNNIPSEYLQKNYVASSGVSFIDESSWRLRMKRYLDSGTNDFYGAFVDGKMIGMIGATWLNSMPAYVIHNLRIFKVMPGFPIQKNGYADLLSHVINLGESKNLWEIYTKRSLEVSRWGNRKYVDKIFKQVPIGVKYERAIVEIIDEKCYSKWPFHDNIFGKELSQIKTAVIKYWCPPKERNNKWIPKDFYEGYVKTYFDND